ncbi:protease modulator HflC [Thiohalophilus thiocyanatoxydans]|uniref:Protein HflC n=1 Tax=Thiohalophilus thiocyanatoxydans TaxID=381308 RepID=A0A4V3H3H2_9GAMM|nr:protease modulator HflC [Thiohalophilus thiocyanatoxydans]TDX99274.1 protease FtsH subunit HflC [Thiohalophilus thiocyanatoxydans]
MSPKLIAAIVVLAIIGLIGSNSLFTVSERELAIQFALGKVKKADFEPGLHVKWPFVNNVRKYEKRIITADTAPQRYLTQEQKPLIVDYYVKWRIDDVETYYKTMQGMESRARMQFQSIVNKGLLDAFGERTLQEVISDARDDIMRSITKEADKRVQSFGIEIVDVRLKRIELTERVFENIFERMSSAREKEAKELRASGRGEAERIRAEAERQKTVMLANAYREAQAIRGQGDAKSAGIYANAFSEDEEFYSFYRSLNAYRKSLAGNGNMMLLEPDSEFFKYFKNSNPGNK